MAMILGIDLGAHSVKLAELDGGFGRFQIVGYHAERVQNDEDGGSTLEARLAALRVLLDRIDPDRGTLYGAGFPTEEASVRLVRLPLGDRAKVQQALPFAVEGIVPFDLDEMLLTSRIAELTPNSSSVLAGIAQRDGIQQHLSALQSVSADPKCLVIDADLLGQYAGSGIQAVVDFGHTRTLIALCRDGAVIAARAVKHGGRDITRAIARRTDCGFSEAEQKKHSGSVYQTATSVAAVVIDDGPQSGSLPAVDAQDWEREDTQTHATSADPTELPDSRTGSPQTDINGLIREAITPLLLELRATLVQFEDEYTIDIEEVTIAGGGASLEGLRDWLGTLLGVPIRRADVSPEADAAGSGEQFALADASAKIAVTGRGSPLDLRRDEFAFKGDLQLLGNIARWSAAALVLFVIAGIGWFGYRTVSLNAELTSLDEQIADVIVETFPDVRRERVDGNPSTAMAIMQEKSGETTAQVDALGSVIQNDPPLLTTLRDISKGMPAHADASLDVTELTIGPTTISLKLETGGFEDAAKIESALKTNAKFKQAQKGDEKKRRDKVRFTITIPLEGNDEEEG